MKSTSFFLSCALLSVFLFSCQKEAGPLPVSDEEITSKTLPLAIYNSACYLDGESLTVYDPNATDFETYNAEYYHVEWKIGSEQVGSGVRVECVCSNTITVVVTDLITGESAQLDYRAIDCTDDE